MRWKKAYSRRGLKNKHNIVILKQSKSVLRVQISVSPVKVATAVLSVASGLAVATLNSILGRAPGPEASGTVM